MMENKGMICLSKQIKLIRTIIIRWLVGSGLSHYLYNLYDVFEIGLLEHIFSFSLWNCFNNSLMIVLSTYYSINHSQLMEGLQT